MFGMKYLFMRVVYHFQKKGINTKRYKNIVVKTEQEDCDWYFSGAPNPSDGKGSWERESSNKQDEELRTLESVCVQHEVDHLNGMTIMDRQVVTTIVNKEKKFGRNEMVEITDGKILSTMKWKKAKPLIDSGIWELYVGGPLT